MTDPYILFSRMQTNYRKYKQGGAGANYAYRCAISAALELLEQDGPNPFTPQQPAPTKIQGVVTKKGAKRNDEESRSIEWAN